MSKILYDNETIKVMSMFTSITKVPLKDCFFDGIKYTFVVFSGNIRHALGKDAINVKRIEQKLQKKIRIVEYNEDMQKFIKNMLLPFKVNEIQINDGLVTVKSDDLKTKSLIIGKNARNLRTLETNVRRYFPELKEIKVE
jgi:NusA-like KH domain protein